MTNNQVLILIVALLLGLPMLACGGCVTLALLVAPTDTVVSTTQAVEVEAEDLGKETDGYIQRDCKVFAQAGEGKVVGFLSRKDQVTVRDSGGPWLGLSSGDVKDADGYSVYMFAEAGYHIHRSVFGMSLPAPLAPEGMTVVQMPAFGFANWDDAVRAGELYNSGDTDAHSKFMATLSLQGNMAMFEKGEVVYVDDPGIEASKVRKKGDTKAFWVMDTLLDR